MVYSSCKGCTDRKLGCHGTCVEYYNYKVKYENDKKKYKEQINPIITKGSFLGNRVSNPKKSRRT